MLNNRHRRLFRQEIKQQYGIQIHKEQIKDLTPNSFECASQIKCNEEFNLTGKVLELHVFPYRVDFEWTANGVNPSEQCINTILKENDLNFLCNITLLTVKPTKLPLSKTFLLRSSNEPKNILFDESILERLSNIELNLKKINSLINITLNDEEVSNLVISEEYDEENDLNIIETKKLVASIVKTQKERPPFKGIFTFIINYLHEMSLSMNMNEASKKLF